MANSADTTKRADRKCSVEGCGRQWAKNGMCDMHHQRVRKHGSTELKKREFPNQGRECGQAGCSRDAKKRGFCDTHYKLAIRRGQLSTGQPVPLCVVDGCGSRRVGKGYCNKHYTRFQKHQDPTAVKGRRTWGPVCTAQGCAETAKSAGYCWSHYNRKLRYGDPELVKRTTKAGEPLRWLKAHIDHDGIDCLIWPFAKFLSGYGQINDADSKGAHRKMCILAHGPPPAPNHEAAHSCGKGHKACVHPRHLSWKLPVENAADKIAHGTKLQGTQHPLTKLTDEAVLQIFVDPRPQRVIAAEMGVDQQNISKIKRGESWSWLTAGMTPSQPNRQPSGSENGNSKLTAEHAMGIFIADGPLVDVARRFGVSPRTVTDIKTGRTWKAVTHG